MDKNIPYTTLIDSQVTFRHCYLDVENQLTINEEFNLIIFIISGQLLLCNGSIAKEVDYNSMVLLKIGNTYQIKALYTAELLFYYFKNSSLIDISININMYDDSTKQNRDTISFLCYETVLASYVDLVCSIKDSSIDYFENYELFKIKQKVFFMLLNYLYNKNELAQFFNPILNTNLEFEEKVLFYYKEAKTVRNLAELCGYGERNFSRKFVNCFGVSPYKWMIKHTSKKVYELLKTNKTFKDIMYECMFSSQAHLTKFCKKYLGGTPSSIRSELRSNIQISANDSIEI